MPVERAAVGALIEQFCTERELTYQVTGELAYVVTLPGTRKLATSCRLWVGEHAVRIEAFVLRAPEEGHREVYAWLLRRNARLYALAFAIDGVGDIYLTGRVGLAGMSTAELDRLLGAVLTYADEAFNPLLEIGFRSAIQREHAWRVARGEPTANLSAFRHLVEPS